VPTDRSHGGGDVAGRDPLDLLIDRLADAELSPVENDIVLSAAVGDEALGDWIGEGVSHRPEPTASPLSLPPPTFLRSVSVTGLRGIGDKTELILHPGPGLTLVVGRNGSGKSSFAEAVELALTGTSSRWSARSKDWLEGWSNLHYASERQVEVQLCIEGRAGNVMVHRSWPPGAALGESDDYAQRAGDPRKPIADLGLAGPLTTWRPFLSYNELGVLLEEGPSQLYDAISRVLGFEQWVEIEGRISVARKDLEDANKAARTEGERLRELLRGLEDDRATALLAALPARKAWDLGLVESHVVVRAEPGTSSIDALQVLANMGDLDEGAFSSRAEVLGQVLETAKATAGGDAGRARRLADLLQQAVDVQRDLPDASCPVCSTADVLTEQWRKSALSQVDELRKQSAGAEAASTAVSSAVRAARTLITGMPAVVGAGASGVDTERLKTLWQCWVQAPESAEDLLKHLSGRTDLETEITTVREAARAELKRRQDLWNPVAVQIAGWLPQATRLQHDTEVGKQLKNAADWLNQEITLLRNERFAPIAKQVQATWERLRQTSNVSVDDVELVGTKTRRRVNLSVSVDETEGAALAVMSQGELHALALSLFLPRATLPESPFRFIVIDDPVQAMDAARVDGLALALADVAVTHQVIVLTHDERLPEAVRRLGCNHL
jgi:ABC-type hemin transport system ATPase subunit